MAFLFRRAFVTLFFSCVLTGMRAHAQTMAHPPTLFVVGDVGGSLGAAPLETIFDHSLIHVTVSSAQARSVRAYINSGEWDTLLKTLHTGDFVLIEFGGSQQAESSKTSDDATRILTGDGDGTFDYLDPGTHKLELVHSYGWYLRRLVVDTINHGGSPILCAPPSPDGAHLAPVNAAPGQDRVTREGVPRSPGAPALNAPADGTALVDTPVKQSSTYAEWAAYVAHEQRIPLLDLSASGPNPDAAALRSDLETLKPDPLAPYMTKP